MRPTDDEIRGQLGRIIASGGFANADRMSEFLRFVVERALAGEGDQVKEYVIGVEVFRRDAEYDPRLDSIVRVEARRLRTKIDEYYAGPGQGDPVIIRIPRGSYVPVFETREVPAPTPAIAATPSVPSVPVVRPPVDVGRRAGFRIALVLMALTIALVVLAAWRTGLWVTAESKPSVAVLPFAQYSTDPADSLFAAELTDRVTSELARTQKVSVVSRTSAAQFASRQQPLREIAQTLGASLIMEGSVGRDGDMVRVDARLVSAITDRKVWVETYVASAADLHELPRRVAGGVASAALAANRSR